MALDMIVQWWKDYWKRYKQSVMEEPGFHAIMFVTSFSVGLLVIYVMSR
jgi:hypothetical protein